MKARINHVFLDNHNIVGFTCLDFKEHFYFVNDMDTTFETQRGKIKKYAKEQNILNLYLLPLSKKYKQKIIPDRFVMEIRTSH